MLGSMVREFVFSAIMVFSAAFLVYRWHSLYDRLDPVVVFMSALLMASLAALVISLEIRMQTINEEFQNVRRAIAITAEELESRIAKSIKPEIKELESKIESLQRKLYR